jgi:hypothetical protein
MRTEMAALVSHCLCFDSADTSSDTTLTSSARLAGFSIGTHHPETRVESFMQSRLPNDPRHPEHPCATAGAVTRP